MITFWLRTDKRMTRGCEGRGVVIELMRGSNPLHLSRSALHIFYLPLIGICLPWKNNGHVKGCFPSLPADIALLSAGKVALLVCLFVCLFACLFVCLFEYRIPGWGTADVEMKVSSGWGPGPSVVPAVL